MSNVINFPRVEIVEVDPEEWEKRRDRLISLGIGLSSDQAATLFDAQCAVLDGKLSMHEFDSLVAQALGVDL